MQRKEQIFKQTNICPHELSKSILKTSFTSYGIIRIIFFALLDHLPIEHFCDCTVL